MPVLRRPSRNAGAARIGVDLVELGRARALWNAHRGRLAALVGAREARWIGSGARAHERLARVIAAKEAVFKASGRAWFGPAGFRALRLDVDGRGRLVRRGGTLGFRRSDAWVLATFRAA